MKIVLRKLTGTWIGFTFALLGVAPAIADDTELLLVNPDPNTANSKPNIMFIMDTSGSMTTLEETTVPYDSLTTYEGPCDTESLYWSTVDIVPVCDGNNRNNFKKSVYMCKASEKQIDGIGTYTDTMVMFRSSNSGDDDDDDDDYFAWNSLQRGNTNSLVECESDSGAHGDGTAGEVYVRRGSKLSTPYTSNNKSELAWGSAPANISYTVYDGNYLNWKLLPQVIDLERINIVKVVAKKVLNSTENINVGIQRFNDRDGGPVILGMVDLDENRQAVLDAIDALPADGRTPLSETLYENALYWRGMPAYYGEMINEVPTAANALASTNPEVYRGPITDVCAKNYNVLLTDGEPVDDLDTPTLAPGLPNFSTVLNRSACTGTGQGLCLDDVAEYLAREDISATDAGSQTVITHTIGFTIDLPILRETAQNSGGKYFLADDIESLTLTLLSILSDINDRSLSFSAPAVSVNTFNRTQNLNDLYLTMFGARTKAHWPGNLKKYKITDRVITDASGLAAVNPNTGFFYDTAISYWTAGADGNDVRLGGAVEQLPDPLSRNLFTNNVEGELNTAINLITPSNAGAFELDDFGLTGAVGEPTVEEIIRWMRGEDVRNEDGNIETPLRKVIGDPLHSQPAAVVYGGTPENPEVVVYMATNDGYLHAISGATGQELWAFAPKELLKNQMRLYFDPDSKYKSYGIDGNIVPVVKDGNQNGIVDGEDFVMLLFGLRRGGNRYYALDVTDRNAPKLKWVRRLEDAGQSWSTPVIARIDINTGGLNGDKAVAVIGGGYDPVHDTASHPNFPDGVGGGIHFIDLQTGADLWRVGADAGASLTHPDMTRAIATQVKVVDFSGDGFADRMYASDMGGQVWRFDIANGETPANLVAGGVIARLGAEGTGGGDTETRRFYNSPDASIFTDKLLDRRFVGVSIGSGHRASPFDVSVADRFFSIRDPNVFTAMTQEEYNNYPVVTDASLVEVSGKKQVELTEADRGWKFTLPANQKVLADSVTFNNEVMFVAFSPDANAAQICAAGRGTNYLYRVSVINGDPIVNNLDALAPGDADNARRQTLQQGGIAPTPTILFPSPDDADCSGADCSPPPIGCVGVECFDPGFANDPVRTLWTQDGVL